MNDEIAASNRWLETSEDHGILGAIEAYDNGRLRGWMFDPRSPGRAQALAVALDGVVVATMLAALPREDRDFDGRSGCLGFDAAIDLGGAARRELRVFLRDQPYDGLNPIILDGDAGDPWGRDVLGRVAHLVAHLTATHEASTRRIQHVFDHVTATHEANDRRIQHVFDHVTATHERVLAQVRTGAASARPTDSGFAGIGQYRAQEQLDYVERAIFEGRIKNALAGF